MNPALGQLRLRRGQTIASTTFRTRASRSSRQCYCCSRPPSTSAGPKGTNVAVAATRSPSLPAIQLHGAHPVRRRRVRDAVLLAPDLQAVAELTCPRTPGPNPVSSSRSAWGLANTGRGPTSVHDPMTSSGELPDRHDSTFRFDASYCAGRGRLRRDGRRSPPGSVRASRLAGRSHRGAWPRS